MEDRERATQVIRVMLADLYRALPDAEKVGFNSAFDELDRQVASQRSRMEWYRSRIKYLEHERSRSRIWRVVEGVERILGKVVDASREKRLEREYR